jgi:hypothetical protein
MKPIISAIQERPHLIQLVLCGLICSVLSVIALSLYPFVAFTPWYAIEHFFFGLAFTLFFYVLNLCMTLSFKGSLLGGIAMALFFHLGNEFFIDEAVTASHVITGLTGVAAAIPAIYCLQSKFPSTYAAKGAA